MNVHDIQRGLWGEAKSGAPKVLNHYELMLWPNSAIFYIRRNVGERVSGKIYELTDEQLEATDHYETDAYKRVKIDGGPAASDDYWVYVINNKQEKEE